MKKSLPNIKTVKGGLKLNLQTFATEQTFPEPNLQTQALHDNFVEVSYDYANRFTDDITGLADAIGISRVFSLAEGFTITMYDKPVVDLADGNVPEGEIIPLSKVTPQPAETKEIKLLKYRKATSGEDIQRYGLERAVNLTDRALVKELQKGIRTDLFAAIQSGRAVANLNTDKGMQGALATAWSALQVAFEDDTVGTVAFAHPNDIGQLIADKEVTLESQFGLNYYESVTGTIVFTSTQVAEGSIYATTPDNLQIAYVGANSEVGRAFQLTSDSTGFIGMKHFLHNESATHQTLLMSGVLIFPERLDGIVKVNINETPEV